MDLNRRHFLTASSLALAATPFDIQQLIAQAAQGAAMQTPPAPPQTA